MNPMRFRGDQLCTSNIIGKFFMKVILLAGGYGSRLSEYTEIVPKPMVHIGQRPILWHIMNTYAHYGHKDFYVALGYKAEIIKKYFLNYFSIQSNFTVDLSTGSVLSGDSKGLDWKVTLVDTGIDTMTGGRIKRLKEYLSKEETFLLTYGDGVSNINIEELLAFHKAHGKMVTLTAVRPVARFGELKIDKGVVQKFQEKPQLNQGWINGGFFVIESKFLDLIEGDKTMLEREPLEAAAKLGELMAYQHEGFWQCMDTKRDCALLEELWKKDQAPWKI